MPQAKWLVKVDWNGDGDFDDANEDVTSDVLGLTLEHLRDLVSGLMEAARLELQLRNDDHKYSPPNSSSPLSGNLKPGRKVWLRAAYPFDSFTDSSGIQLANHSPDYDGGFSWSEHLQGFDIISGSVGVQADGSEAGGDCVAPLDFGDAYRQIGCDFTKGTDASDHGGLCFRYSDTSNYLLPIRELQAYLSHRIRRIVIRCVGVRQTLFTLEPAVDWFMNNDFVRKSLRSGGNEVKFSSEFDSGFMERLVARHVREVEVAGLNPVARPSSLRPSGSPSCQRLNIQRQMRVELPLRRAPGTALSTLSIMEVTSPYEGLRPASWRSYPNYMSS